MARVRVVLNRSGVRDLLRSDEVRGDLSARARRISAAAGEGYEADSETGRNRARASVRTATVAAARDNAERHSLARALDAGRG